MIVITEKGNVDAKALAAGEVYKEVNNVVFGDSEDAIKYGVRTYGTGNFQMFRLCPTCTEDTFRKDEDSKLKSQYRLAKRAKLLEEINL